MKILLYKPEAQTAFKLFTQACEVIIPSGSEEVLIVNPATYSGVDDNAVLARYRLVKEPFATFTNDTKSDKELMVKLVVEELV